MLILGAVIHGLTACGWFFIQTAGVIGLIFTMPAIPTRYVGLIKSQRENPIKHLTSV